MSPGPDPPGEHPLVFVVDLEGCVLDDEDHHHLRRVLRIRPGDAVTAADGRGSWRACRLGTGPGLEPAGGIVATPPPQPRIGVGFALLKGDRNELVVQKLTELGVDEIRPFHAARSVVRWDVEKRERAHARLVRVAREAAMQSRRPWLPEVAPVARFADVAARPGTVRADRGGGPPAPGCPLVLVGPEGGWAPEERAVPLPAVSLGDGVLRAETAALAAGALLAALRTGLVAPGVLTRVVESDRVAE